MPYAVSKSARRAASEAKGWVFLGGVVLASIAGFINVCVLGFFHVPISHMTGAVSRLSIDLEARDLTDIQVIASILFAFFVGAAISGVIIGRKHLVPGSRYGVTLVLEGIFLALATWMLVNGQYFGVTLAAMACGIQNAMASSYYGLILRTTHMTGIITDIGVLVGHLLRHRRVRIWKLFLLVSIVLGFFLGGLLGAIALRRFGLAAFSAPAFACVALGVGYVFWQEYRQRHALRSRA